MARSRQHPIFFSVGEPSGDLHAGRLIQRMRSIDPTLNFTGLGGPAMARAGCSILYNLTDLAVMGFVEVVPKLREFFRVADLANDHLKRKRPKALVLVDFPGFNWHMAKRAKKLGIPVFYYLPPQMWAWGQWRLGKMKRWVDHVLCSLSFEHQWYEQRGVRAHFVGHPFFDEVHERALDLRFLERWRYSEGVQVAVLPGSRAREVEHIWPMQLSIIREISRRHPSTRFLVACLKDSHCIWCRQKMTEADSNLKVEFFSGRTSEIIHLADCSLMKSGSVSLEMMARCVPSVVVYHVGRVLYEVARRLTDIETFTLPNMLAGDQVMDEFLAVGTTHDATLRATEALDRLVGDPGERQQQRDRLASLAERFARAGASDRAARVILTELGILEAGRKQAA